MESVTDVMGGGEPELLTAGYPAGAGRHDEYVGLRGGVRPGWRGVMSELEKIGPQGLANRDEQLRWLVREMGVTYNVYGEGEMSGHPWEMDLVPFLLRGDDFLKLETALGQRARVLNEVLADCYGGQRLLEKGVFPADLVYGNPRYLPACQRLMPRHWKHLWVYAADVVRAANGSWWVLSDRLDASSGLGYALENRQLTHRVLPELLRVGHVRRLVPFMDRMRESVESLAPVGTASPQVVLLTPGQQNETYFEQAFLARSMGWPLVEGDDLAVRGGRLMLKTISGNQPVHVVMRRLDSEWCDPLEMRSDSMLGVAGMVQSVREGSVGVANGLGSGLLEGPAFSAFLPGAARELLGENLMMPSVATWWCGQAKERNYVLENLRQLHVKPAMAGRTNLSAFGPGLSDAEVEQWRARIESEPKMWCAQERVDRATTPSFVNGKLEPRPFVLRLFLVRHGGCYRMMPGGLVRTGAEGDIFSMQAGGVSKDVWVMGAEPSRDDAAAAAKKSRPITVRRSAINLPSRVADNLYWLGRYLERAEGQARLLRVVVGALMDDLGGERSEALARMFSVLATSDELVGLRKRGGRIDLEVAEKVVRWWARDPANTAGMVGTLRSILRSSGQVKERLSLDTWQFLSRLDGLASTLPLFNGAAVGDGTLRALDEVVAILSGMSGMAAENMTRGSGWVFQDLGRRMERGVGLCNLVYSTLQRESAEKAEEPLLQQLLLCADSLLTYRRRYLATMDVGAVLDLLLLDPGNPRSLKFQVEKMAEDVAGLPVPEGGGGTNPIGKSVERVRAHLALCSIEEIGPADRGGRRLMLEGMLDTLAGELAGLSNLLGEHFFAVTVRPVFRGLGGIPAESGRDDV